ncbi:MAG TPA: ABC transporter ATP-binding protein [Candidatus Limnocylindrales bacterium]|nr:ABC transporter ATP-binding protein [Candidatus Limnocylindrales bacterium]
MTTVVGGAGRSTATAGAPDAVAGIAIRARGLTKRFGSVVALDGLDLDVPAGAIFGLLGPNGAGKTTTIRILTGLARQTAGTATVAGVEVGLDRPELRRRLGYLDQDPRFYGWMRGRELLELVGRLVGLDGPALRERVGDMLERTGLTAAANRRIGGYSGGMRQRLGIAQALLHRPTIVFLDEPVSSLDPEGRRDVLALIEGLRGETTVIVSTHVLSDVERICDRVAILDRGRLVTEAPLERLLADHIRPVYRLAPEPGQDAAVAAFIGRLRATPWVTDVATAPEGDLRVSVNDPITAGPSLLAIVVDEGVRLAVFERVRPTLEDVFLELVGTPSADELDGRGFIRPREVGR